MGRNAIETVIGALVLVVAALFLWVAYDATRLNIVPGYRVSAGFSQLGGLPSGSDVQIGGIKVGSVTERRLDPATFDAVVVMTIDNGIRLPADTIATIASEGILGGKFVRLLPGKSSEIIPPDGRITQTRPYRSLEDQVGEIIFLATAKPAATGEER
jgi:phospholipid/cholesterol/gamma-HCH transport system substrate-binding protein